jgi:hypothetical protein
MNWIYLDIKTDKDCMHGSSSSVYLASTSPCVQTPVLKNIK